MTSSFIGEFCEVREVQSGRKRAREREREAEEGEEGRGTPAGMLCVF